MENYEARHHIIKDSSPLGDELVKPDFDDRNGKFSVLKNNPNVVIRSEPCWGSQEETEKFLDKGELLFRELSEQYSVPLPPFEAVTGKNKAGEETIFIITERIQGENLYTLLETNPPAELREKLEALCEGLSKYFLDKYKSGGMYLSDINPTQFIYGTRPGRDQKEIYWMDFDLYRYRDLEKSSPAELRLFLRYVDTIAYMILQAEQGYGTRFGVARGLLKDFTKQVKLDDLYDPEMLGDNLARLTPVKRKK
jgi:hypothetical protein